MAQPTVPIKMSSAPGTTPPTLFNPNYRRTKENQRFSISAEQYLAWHSIPEYLSDAMRLMTEADDNAPLEFLSAYFQNVVTGDNVIFRDFAYINATNRNRRSFIRHLRETFQKFDHKEISVDSLHQLFCLVCPDYPIQHIRCAFRIYQSRQGNLSIDTMGYSSESPTLKSAPFADFMRFACLFFYFSEFIFSCGKLFAECERNNNAGISIRAFRHILSEITDTNTTIAVPDQQIIEDTLQQLDDSESDTLFFDVFCCALFNHNDIPMMLLEPTSYTELKESIDRLLERISTEQSADVLRARRKPKKSDRKEIGLN